LIDHLIRSRQQRGRDREAERLGGLEVHDTFALSWAARRAWLPGDCVGIGGASCLIADVRLVIIIVVVSVIVPVAGGRVRG
jgi:hypothetical protein